MSDCAELTDRMPDVRHGRAAWSDAEAAHLASCAACRAEWRLVSAGADLGSQLQVDAPAISAAVLERLRSPERGAVVGRIPWRGVMVAVASIAAVIALVLLLPGRERPGPSTTAPVVATAPTLIPELNDLSEGELETVLQTLQSSVDDGATGGLPRLGDLDETQLEQLLRAEEG